MADKMLTTENLHMVLMEEIWGKRACYGDSFYRLLFKLEKRGQNEATKISNEEMYLMFASYKIWYEKTVELLEACDSDSKGDREARINGEKFKKDVLEHVHSIITESKAETPDWVTKLIVQADVIIAQKQAMN